MNTWLALHWSGCRARHTTRDAHVQCAGARGARAGTFLMNRVLNAMEMVGIAPKGSGKVREMLRQGQLGLVTGGTFTPVDAAARRSKQ